MWDTSNSCYVCRSSSTIFLFSIDNDEFEYTVFDLLTAKVLQQYYSMGEIGCNECNILVRAIVILL